MLVVFWLVKLGKVMKVAFGSHTMEAYWEIVGSLVDLKLVRIVMRGGCVAYCGIKRAIGNK